MTYIFDDTELKDFLREDYMESREMDMIFGELKSTNLSDAKTHSLLYKYLDFAAGLLKCETADLSILEREGIKFELIEKYPTLQRYGFDLIENHHIQGQGYSSGIFLHNTQNKQEKNNIAFVRIRFLADVFLIYKTGELCRLIRGIKAKSSEEMVKPILEEGLLDKIIKETIGYYKNRGKLEEYGIKARKGVVLRGIPGCGKTMCVKYIKQLCRKRNVSFHSVHSSELESAYGKDQLEDIFDEEGITVFDDIDTAWFSRRGAEAKKSCAILSAFDGPESKNNTIRIFTTNEEIEDFDDAFRRPGRLDKVFILEKPASDLRLKFINTWHKDILGQINISSVVEATENYTFAELQGIKVEIASKLIRGETIDLKGLLSLKIEVKETGKRKKKVGFGE